MSTPRLTLHVLERWKQRVDPRGSWTRVQDVVRRARRVPRALWPYFRIEGADDVLWAPNVDTLSTKGVLFIVKGGCVVMCFPPRGPGHRRLLERAVVDGTAGWVGLKPPGTPWVDDPDWGRKALRRERVWLGGPADWSA